MLIKNHSLIPLKNASGAIRSFKITDQLGTEKIIVARNARYWQVINTISTIESAFFVNPASLIPLKILLKNTAIEIADRKQIN